MTYPCPVCDEKREEKLHENEDGTVECASCGCVFDPIVEEGAILEEAAQIKERRQEVNEREGLRKPTGIRTLPEETNREEGGTETMEIKIEGIKEKDIITVKALTMSLRILAQCRELKYQDLALIKDRERLSRWIGYVNEPLKGTAITVVWLLAMDGQNLIKVRETEYFWVVRDNEGPNSSMVINQKLREELDKLPQIFTS